MRPTKNSKIMKITITKFIITFLIFLIYQSSFSSTITGKITDADSLEIAFATIYVKNTTYGCISNYKGEYFLELTQGNYTLVYSFVGYQSIEKEIIIKNNENLTINITLFETDIQIDDIDIIADKIDRAKKIMKNVRDNRKKYFEKIQSFECQSYVKTSIEKEKEEQIIDSTLNAKDYLTYLNNQKLNLIEYISQTFYKNPDKYNEIILAYHNYTEEKPVDELVISIDYGQENIVPEPTFKEDPYIFYNNSTSGNFNFYKNLLDFPALCEQPLVSPIAYNSNLYYSFEFDNSFYENGTKINKIKVKPLNDNSSLFYGNIFIEDSTFALLSVDLFINEKSLSIFENFNIIQNYQKIEDEIYVPTRTEITYTIKEGDEKILGNSKIIYKEIKVNQDFSEDISRSEIISYDEYAFDRDSSYWEKERPISLKYKEMEFIKLTDSIQEYYSGEEYLNHQDSTFNAIRWWSPLVYFGYRNHETGIELYLSGLIEQMIFFGVGGYRHRLPFKISKRFENSMLLETKFQIDYGFRNNDFKGKFGVGLTYFPKKFVRTFVEIGDSYELINNFASLEQAFSRSNYVRCKSLSVSQRMEIINGLFADFSFSYSNQLPINNIQLAKWSDFIFGNLNEPIEFEQYIKSELRFELKYRIGQKYMMRKNQKIIIGTDYPEIFVTYRKGIPKLFDSEVDFDYIEFGANHNIQLARFGESKWKVTAGIFINKSSLRILEHKYFRGSDKLLFSDPLNSLQLLGLTMSTNYQFLQANYIHHFNGAILNKVPLINRLKLSLAAGAGTMTIPEQNFYHIEMFAGIERIFKIRNQPFRIGIYAVTADNTLSKANFHFKFGISYFNDYTNKWSY